MCIRDRPNAWLCHAVCALPAGFTAVGTDGSLTVTAGVNSSGKAVSGTLVLGLDADPEKKVEIAPVSYTHLFRSGDRFLGLCMQKMWYTAMSMAIIRTSWLRLSPVAVNILSQS